MTDVITQGERKGIAKCKPCTLLSVIPEKNLGEIIKIYYLNGQNSPQTFRVCHRNHGLWQCQSTVKTVWDLIHKFEETGCTCEWIQSGQPFIPVEMVAVIHQMISTVRPASARGISCVLNLPNSTVRKILHFVLNMFLFWFQSVQMLEMGDNH